MSYMDTGSMHALHQGVQELSFDEIDAVNGGSTTSTVAGHVAAVTAIGAALAIEVPPLSAGLGAVSLVASAVALWA